MPSRTLVGPHRNRVETMERTFWGKAWIPKQYGVQVIRRISRIRAWSRKYRACHGRTAETGRNKIAFFTRLRRRTQLRSGLINSDPAKLRIPSEAKAQCSRGLERHG